MSTKDAILMIRGKPYYSKKQLRKLIDEGKVFITDQARRAAQNDFGWGFEEICRTLLALPVKSFYKSLPKFDNPAIWVDYYKAYDFKGENVYTHFHVDEGMLIIDSFKEI